MPPSVTSLMLHSLVYTKHQEYRGRSMVTKDDTSIEEVDGRLYNPTDAI